MDEDCWAFVAGLKSAKIRPNAQTINDAAAAGRRLVRQRRELVVNITLLLENPPGAPPIHTCGACGLPAIADRPKQASPAGMDGRRSQGFLIVSGRRL